MGKIKHKRSVLHLPAPKPVGFEGNTLNVPEKDVTYESVCSKDFTSQNLKIKLASQSNIFKNVSIPASALNQHLPDYSKIKKEETDAEDIIPAYILQHKLSLKEEKRQKKRRRKKIPFFQVIEAARLFQKKKLEEKKQKASAILGNFQPMKDALPTLEHLLKKTDLKEKPRAAKTFKRQEQEMMEDIQTFHNVLQDSSFSSDPFTTISAYLKQKLQSDCK